MLVALGIAFAFRQKAEPTKITPIVNSEHPSINVAVNKGFDFTKLDADTVELFNTYNIKGVTITVTSNQTPITTQAYDKDKNSIMYAGYSIEQKEDALSVNLYINNEAIDKLGKTEKQLHKDLLVQLFLSFSDLERLKRGGEISWNEANSILLERYQNAELEADKVLIEQNSPFSVVKK